MGGFNYGAPRVPSVVFRLEAGQVYVPPVGWYFYTGSRSAGLQRFDGITQTWKYTGDDGQAMRTIYADGMQLRVANTTGCVVAAALTTAGSGYTSAPTVTAGAGSAAFTAIVGGAVSTATTISAAGTGYTYPPVLWIEAPPSPGVQATGYTTISNGTISAVTIDGQGAGYTIPPFVGVVNDGRDTIGGGGVVSLALTGAQTVTAVLVNNHGVPITSGTIPTLTFTGGGGSSAVATAIMDWGITSLTLTNGGAGYTAASGSVLVTGAGGYFNGTQAYLGTDASYNSQRWRSASIVAATNASGVITSDIIIDPGRYQAIPTAAVTAAQSPSTVSQLAVTMGGGNATIYLEPGQQQ